MPHSNSCRSFSAGVVRLFLDSDGWEDDGPPESLMESFLVTGSSLLLVEVREGLGVVGGRSRWWWHFCVDDDGEGAALVEGSDVASWASAAAAGTNIEDDK